MINIAVGVVTGLVQEFQFGMDWSTYSRTVGDVFGAPLAMEGLAAFFLESTFLGLWLFGWDKLSRRVHLATIWAVALGAALSAAFIMAANSWMQHPVGYTTNPTTGRPQLSNIWAVITNPVFLRGYLHVLLASLVTASAVMLAVAAWQLRRGSAPDVFRPAARLALVVLTPSVFLAMIVGSELGVTEDEVPADEDRGVRGAVGDVPAVLVLAVPDRRRQRRPDADQDHPDPAPAVAAGDELVERPGRWASTSVQAQYASQYGPGDYVPNVFVQYWSMRVMAYTAGLLFLVALWGLWRLRRQRLDSSPRFLRVAVWAVVLPFLMNTAGWLLTENGRQPWIVQGIQLTKEGVSPSVSTTEVAFSIIVFFLLYAALAVIDVMLMMRYARREIPPAPGG